jgi:hypothetical protein
MGGCSRSARETLDLQMKTTLALCVLLALLLQFAVAPITAAKNPAVGKTATAASQPAGPGKAAELAALEQKLLRTWSGPACGGDFTFKADGTFNVRSFTPGQNILTGSWALRWDALPPTLLLTFKTSDFKKKYPGEPEYKYVGKTLEAKLLELSKDALAFKAPNTDWDWRGEPRADDEDDERPAQK